MYELMRKLAELWNLLNSFQILNKTQDDIYKGVRSTAINKTLDYYRQCMDEQAINNISTAPALKVY